MFDLLVNAEGGLTTAGYTSFVRSRDRIVCTGNFICGKKFEKRKMGTRQLVFCANLVPLLWHM